LRRFNPSLTFTERPVMPVFFVWKTVLDTSR
jgi:hypothetical protein